VSKQRHDYTGRKTDAQFGDGFEGIIQSRPLHNPIDDNPPRSARCLAPADHGERPQRCSLFRNRMFDSEALETPTERLQRGDRADQPSSPGLRRKAAAIAE
jgi:hypothetical protein